MVIAGAGAVGSYLAARFGGRFRVLAITRGEHLEALKSNGLQIGGLEKARCKIEASHELAPLPRNALVVVTAKTTQLEGIADRLRPALAADTLVVLTANGYEPEKRLASLLGRPAERLLVSLGCHLVRPGVLDFWGGGGLEVADTALGRMLQQMCQQVGLACRISDDFRKAVWRKLAANCIVNPLTALLRVRNREIVTPELAGIRRDIAAECAAAAAAVGVTLPPDMPETLDAFILDSNNVSSMLQDVIRKRPTEIDDLNNAVVRVSAAHGLPAPVNATLAALVKGLEKTYEAC